MAALERATTNRLAASAAPGSLHNALRRDVAAWRLRFALLSALLLIVFLVALALGSVNIPLDQIVRVLLGGEAERASWTSIVMQVRLPRALTALLAGAALGTAGLLMQTFFRNLLASPDVLGVNSGASLGVALVVLSTGMVGTSLLAGIGLLGDLGLAAAASIGAGLTMLLVLFVARRVRGSTTLLIVGLMIGQLTFAVVSLLLYFSIPERIQAYINWGFGSFGGVTWSQLPILALAVAAGIALSVGLIKPLNALLLGEAYAESMGVELRRARTGIIVATALLTGAVTAFCGPIAFIGIAVPHLCRGLLRTADHRALLPAALLMGALVAQTAGIVAQMPGSDVVLPLNAVLALLGAPVVLGVILREKG